LVHFKDYYAIYAILDVPRNATPEHIKEAYRRPPRSSIPTGTHLPRVKKGSSSSMRPTVSSPIRLGGPNIMPFTMC
jgi:hypothetical protein